MRRHPASFPVITLVLFLACLLTVYFPVTVRQSAAAISPEVLPEDMRDLVIEDSYISSPFPNVGTIHSLQGTVVVVHRADKKAYLGSEGDAIHENDEFYTLPDSRCRLRFVNEDVVSLGADTRFSVDTYIAQEDTGEKTSIFSMVKGKAMFYAMRLFKFKQARFQVKTPTAVMGVRGTKFGAHVYWIDEKTADSRGGIQVADSGGSIGPYLAQAGSGNGTPVTVAAVGDGYVTVNGVTLGPGQYYNTFSGAVGYDPNVLGGIESDTGGDNGDEGEGEGEGEGNGEGGDGGLGGDLSDTTTNITSTQTGSGTEGSSSPGEGTSDDLSFSGYFASMLLYDSDGVYLKDVFLTKAPIDFGAGAEHRADTLQDPQIGYLIWKDGGYTYVHTAGFEGNISVTTTAQQVSTGYDYLAFGKWAHTGTFEGGMSYFADHAWWLEGLATPDSAIASQKGSFSYSGEAYGTMAYGSSPTVVDMSGSFGTTVNFDTASVQDFTLGVTDGGSHSASIAGASGSIGPDGTFSLIGGTWSMTNTDPPITVYHHEGYGRFFGPNAEEIGGNWGMWGEDYGFKHVGAAGVFGGRR